MVGGVDSKTKPTSMFKTKASKKFAIERDFKSLLAYTLSNRVLALKEFLESPLLWRLLVPVFGAEEMEIDSLGMRICRS